MNAPIQDGPLRVGIDARVLVDHYHGIGRVTYELLTALVCDPDLRFVLFVEPGADHGRFDLAALRERVEIVEFAAPLPSPTQFVRWPRAVRRAGIDVMLHPYQLGAPLRPGCRTLAVVHDCIFETDSSYAPSRRVNAVYRLLTRLVLRKVEIVTPSRASADDVQRFYGRAVPDTHVVPWGVSSAFRDEATPPLVAGRYLLHVGARRPHKRVPFLVRVLAAMEPDMRLVLVGSADARWPDDTMALARSLQVADRVHELSDVSNRDLGALYSGAHAFVYPSAIEGFGLPLLEAMAAGVPVVASDIAVFREVAGTSEGPAAELVSDDVEAWAAAARRLDDDGYRADLVARGLAVADAATWEAAAERLAAVLRERGSS